MELRAEGKTQEQVAELLGLAQQRVGQMLGRHNTSACSVSDVRVKVSPKEHDENR